jgi:FlaA1/EpsC-like NDP-sugar epimerase
MILITGSCGSIGSALRKSLADDIVSLDIKETNGERVDIRNYDEVERVIKNYKPRIVIHAAANKYVDYLESHVEEAIEVNTLGTRNVVLACLEHDVSKMLLISTDKANDPVSVLGYSKRAAEIYTLLSGYSIIRLVNVYESTGNVVEIFKKQISLNQSVTVTDPEMERYFIKIDDACKAIVTAIRSSCGKDMFFVPGQSTKIIDLANELIGQKPIPVEITSPRPGDRIKEDDPIPEDAVQINYNLWRMFYNNIGRAEEWISPLLFQKDFDTLTKLCK